MSKPTALTALMLSERLQKIWRVTSRRDAQISALHGSTGAPPPLARGGGGMSVYAWPPSGVMPLSGSAAAGADEVESAAPAACPPPGAAARNGGARRSSGRPALHGGGSGARGGCVRACGAGSDAVAVRAPSASPPSQPGRRRARLPRGRVAHKRRKRCSGAQRAGCGVARAWRGARPPARSVAVSGKTGAASWRRSAAWVARVSGACDGRCACARDGCWLEGLCESAGRATEVERTTWENKEQHRA